MIKYLDNERQWGKLLEFLLQSGEPSGFDTEFSGVNFRAGQSCPDKARVHVWSLAVYDGGYSPRGFNTARGVVLPACALQFFREYLEHPGFIKYAHNSPVDVHACYNSGVDVSGIVNTLSLARWVCPDRLSQSLDSLSKDHQGVGKFISYKDLTSTPGMVEKLIEVKHCECGVEGCRKRKGHAKTIELVPTLVEKGVVEIPLQTILPGHERWDILVEYAGQDAVLALQEADYLIGLADKKEIEIPWLK